MCFLPTVSPTTTYTYKGSNAGFPIVISPASRQRGTGHIAARVPCGFRCLTLLVWRKGADTIATKHASLGEQLF